MKHDIRDVKDIQLLVDSFYEKVRQDGLLGNIFNEVIGDRWPEHLEKMYRFWQTVLLHEAAYQGSPFQPHMKLPIEGRHFERWLKLFTATIDEHFVGQKAVEAKWRAEKMAEMFQYKLAHYRGNAIKPIQ